MSVAQENQRQLLGASVFGPNEIYQKLKGFKARLQQEFGEQLSANLTAVVLTVDVDAISPT